MRPSELRELYSGTGSELFLDLPCEYAQSLLFVEQRQFHRRGGRLVHPIRPSKSPDLQTHGYPKPGDNLRNHEVLELRLHYLRGSLQSLPLQPDKQHRNLDSQRLERYMH